MNQLIEEWRDIPNHSGYQASNIGKIRNVNFAKRKGRIQELSTHLNREGYVICSIGRVHRLVALAWIDNPTNKRCVNHINEVKTDNSITNLNWMSDSENNNWGTRTQRATQKQKGQIRPSVSQKQKIPVIATNMNDGTELYFDSAKDASLHGFNATGVSECIRGVRKWHKGYYWKKG